MVMYRIGMSTWNSESICDERFLEFNKAGITDVEISVPASEYENLDYKNILRLSKEYDVNLWSYHLPFAPFDKVDLSDKKLCKNTVAYFGELIKKVADIGIDKIVVHSSAEPILDKERKEKIETAKESLASLANAAKQSGCVIAVEDLPRSCIGRNSDEILELISADPSLCVCFDTNHLLCEDHADFIKKAGNKIITTHISDYDLINERHWMPAEGIIDWQKVLQALKDVEYSGIWLYEVSFSAPWSIVRNRDLTSFDFIKNANEIFVGKKPSVLGKPKENIGMWPKD